MADHECLSRGELLNWVNDLLKLNLTRIEQLGTGAVHCQILDMIYPGKIPLHKVNWRAKYEYEFIYNFKLLQQAFTKCSITKYVDVERLVKARYQDNLEFAQWIKKYFDANYASKEYDPAARRGNLDPDFSFVEKISVTKQVGLKEGLSKGPSTLRISKPATLRGFGAKSDLGAKLNSSLLSGGTGKENELSMSKYECLEQLEVIKAERDFYFAKLRDIDQLIDLYRQSSVEELVSAIRDILYMTPEKVAIVGDDGTLRIQMKPDEQNKGPIDVEDHPRLHELTSGVLAEVMESTRMDEEPM
eukprot:TRINITY_DN2410_c0_g1_i2.p1 TRINITY_DN2410_c0_g1~~TRINITY_DN2410_c0_g1_i2.p1  ORF type:complete len:302 (-),score=62.82 TRINITY_DN2410_c0_g1_i2:157-1062(-)